MKKIRIYQADMNCDWVFMDYEFAKEKNFNMKWYTEVASFDDEDDGDDDKILNKLWNIGNDGTLKQSFRMRSVSVSDILEIEGRRYYVDSFGFKEC